MKRRRTITTTMLDLVQTVQDLTVSDREAVAVVTYLVNSGKVVLAGSLAGQRIAAG